ncbi:MAG: nicotinamide mononucleotide transporter [Prevotella sp.]|nr:nicotinamide mononucleotide transporter [Prevotella sp.]
MDYLSLLDITGFVVGLFYLYFEYRASIYLWIASIIMPLVDMFLYYEAGLYADFGMSVYYCLAAVYGWCAWKYSSKTPAHNGNGEAGVPEVKSEKPITHFPLRRVLPVSCVFAVVWVLIYYILIEFTNSDVPVTDSFTTALSVIAMWALARKYVEQWLLWLVVDAVCTVLYVYKGIPFKALIYGIYTLVAVAGYLKWKKMAAKAAR